MHIGPLHAKHLLASFLCFAAMNSVLRSESAPGQNGFYVGVFAGGGTAMGTSLEQRGAVYLNPPAPRPRLPIRASGSTDDSTVSFGGTHIGYSWSRSDRDLRWSVTPAAEVEGLHLGTHTPTGEMPVMPRFLGTQYVTVPLTADVFLINAVFTFRTPYSARVLPYVGVGVGAAFVSIKDSNSANPSEPGINHFNSDPHASDSAWAIQFKAGVKGQVYKNLSLFIEYRYLTIDSTSYKFGSTNYPGVHLPTTAWHAELGRQDYNLFVAGLQYRF